ncbi:MAG: cell division protein FtsA [Tannerellaceae bacterium]|jgi:cell division protein FtsA|nr:cell division protein FtsA [Tannerellaceae bacterium]
MTYTNFIAAIHLGTSRITGIVGRSEAGTLTVIAYDTEVSAHCIRRGCIYNVKDTADKVRRLIRKLELKTPGSRIGKVYVGIGGQSVRSVEYTVSRAWDTDCILTDEIMDQVNEECRAYQPDRLDVVSVMPPVCYLNGRMEPEPIGISCSRMEARYQLIVARPSIRKITTECISKLAKTEIAEILISPLALADVVLSEDEKNRGCALIDFGAGVTSLTVYKHGHLLSLCVIPLGGNLITRDIEEFLGIGEAEAEQLKRKYGKINKNEDLSSQINAEFNKVVEARLEEILENVYKKLEDTIGLKELRAGIIVTGKAANLENLTTFINNRLKIDSRYAIIRKDLTVNTNLPDTHPDGVALGLLLQGTINCSVNIPIPPPPSPPPVQPSPAPPVEKKETVTETIQEETPSPPGRQGKQGKKGGKKPGFLKKVGEFAGTLFDEDKIK